MLIDLLPTNINANNIGPNLPTIIKNEMSILEDSFKLPVIPVVNPTFPKALTHSKSNSLNMVSGSNDEIIMKENIIIIIEKINIIRDLLIISLLTVLLNKTTSSLPMIVEIRDTVIIESVPTLIPPATDKELPPINISAIVVILVLLCIEL